MWLPGGYAFCAVAALALLGEAHRLDRFMLERWLAERQLPLEGGFAGRTNKLVDGCYTFWQVTKKGAAALWATPAVVAPALA